MAAYLVTIDGLRGPETQIWYGEPGKFVGRSDHAVLKIKLPERDSWSIADASAWAIEHPDEWRAG
jgi:hypothetical protein